jgi:sugar fermentation stimulation protein A
MKPVLESGCYLLQMNLGESVAVRVGALGEMSFAAGRYLYVGRALRALPARIARHRRREKRLRWHIDYFLAVSVLEAIHVTTCTDEEAIAFALLGHSDMEVIDGFGASDSRCSGHLFRLAMETNVDEIIERLVPGCGFHRWDG